MTTKSIYFPPASHISHNKIDKCGHILISAESTPQQLEDANRLIGSWRASHLYPLNTFRSTLIRKVARYESTIVAQRLKRMNTIIRKLIRYPNMQLSTMQDIAGLRAILNSPKEVYDDGYRGIHIVFKYVGRNEIAHQYDGLLIELQLRTKLQHTWATAVEAAGIINNEKYKNGRGNKAWLKFFKLASEAFEVIEYLDNSKSLIRKPTRRPIEIYSELAELDKKEHILEKLVNYSNAIDIIDKNNSPATYYIILLLPSQHEVKIYSFTKNEYANAIKIYSELENNAKTSNSDQVLVSVGDIKNLRLAYPSYFADITDFVEEIKILKQLTLVSWK